MPYINKEDSMKLVEINNSQPGINAYLAILSSGQSSRGSEILIENGKHH